MKWLPYVFFALAVGVGLFIVFFLIPQAIHDWPH